MQACDREATKPRMGVNSCIGKEDPRFGVAATLYAKGGYGELGDGVEEIHCEKEKFTWMENGFLQTFSEVDGRRCRVLIYLPGQILQPHKHDMYEHFVITFGSVDLWKWSADGTKSLSQLTAGNQIEVPVGTVHALRVGSNGLTFHELVDAETFGKRSTEFQDTSIHPMPSIFCQKTVLVTGSNRGLGLGFVQHFRNEGAKVVECCRNPTDKATQLQLDLSDLSSVSSLAERLKAAGVNSIDYLINNAGVASKNHPNDPIVSLDLEDTKRVFDVNLFGTVAVTQSLLPFLDSGHTRAVITISSQLGSIEKCWGMQGRYGGVASYRMARAASNMAMRTFGGELKDSGYIFVAMSPGHVATDMGSAGGRVAPLTVDESVGGMLNVLRKLSPEHNGKFWQYDDTEIPW